jgi:hypothetical protein
MEKGKGRVESPSPTPVVKRGTKIPRKNVKVDKNDKSASSSKGEDHMEPSLDDVGGGQSFSTVDSEFLATMPNTLQAISKKICNLDEVSKSMPCHLQRLKRSGYKYSAGISLLEKFVLAFQQLNEHFESDIRLKLTSMKSSQDVAVCTYICPNSFC